MAINALAALRYQGGLKSETQINFTAIPTTVGLEAGAIVAEDGVLESVDFSAAATLAANDTNYVSFYVMNLGQDGLGTVQMLIADQSNTTKVTGGSQITAYARRKLKLSTSTNNLKVKKGDVLKVSAQVFGTLPGAVPFPVFLLRFIA